MTADNGWMQLRSRDKNCGAVFDAPFPAGTGYYRPPMCRWSIRGLPWQWRGKPGGVLIRYRRRPRCSLPQAVGESRVAGISDGTGQRLSREQVAAPSRWSCPSARCRWSTASTPESREETVRTRSRGRLPSGTYPGRAQIPWKRGRRVSQSFAVSTLRLDDRAFVKDGP